MHGLQTCLFKYNTVAAFHIYLRVVKMLLKGEVGGHALKSHENYIVDHGNSWQKHGIVFLNFCGNPLGAWKKLKSHTIFVTQDPFFSRMIKNPKIQNFLQMVVIYQEFYLWVSQ